MAGNENGKNAETVESKAPLLWIFFLAMGLVTLTALGDEIFDYIGTDQERTTTESYYQSKCHEIETSGFPSFAVNEYKDHGNRGADWGKNYPPYCALAAQYVSANSAARSAVWNKWMLLLTGVGVVLLWLTWRETERVTKVTREVGNDQNRAYVSAIEARLYFDKNQYAEMIGIYIKNTGKSPARNFRVDFIIEEIDKVNSEWYGDFKKVTDDYSASWSSLGSDSETSIGCAFYEYFGIKKVSKIVIKGKIFYETIYGELYRTDFVYRVKKKLDDVDVKEDEHNKKYLSLLKPSADPTPVAFKYIQQVNT